jgi:hypothetical protein
MAKEIFTTEASSINDPWERLEAERMRREVQAARDVLRLNDAFHDMNETEQAEAVDLMCIYSRAALAATPELRAWAGH